MKRLCSAIGAATFAFGAAVFAQSTPSAQPQSKAESMDQQVTITGCVVKESDYRQARDAGKGGAAGTGVGAGNEFVLTDASSGMSGSSSADRSPSPTGTAGSAAGAAYELTGPNEGQLSTYVGKRVEITGQIKKAETTASGKPTGGATAGEPPRGVDVTSTDLKLREFEVASVREAPGTCPAAK
jgi:hypothetical protein